MPGRRRKAREPQLEARGSKLEAHGFSINEYWCKLSRSCLLWFDADLSRPFRLHDATCTVENGRCSCRTVVDQLAAHTLVVRLKQQGEASLVSISGAMPVWVESAAVEQTKISIGESPRASSVPTDYLEWMALLDEPVTGKKRRIRAEPAGGALVFVRADELRLEPWRWIGHVHQDGQRALLLVDPMVPLDQVLDVRPEQVRVVPLGDRLVRNVLVPALPSFEQVGG